MSIIRRSDCVPLPIVVFPVVAVVMLESSVARCVHCVENVACHPTLQHHNSYKRTDNYRQWKAVGSPDDGHKDARNMLRYYWLPINHYLLHLVGFSFTYLSNIYGHSNRKFAKYAWWFNRMIFLTQKIHNGRAYFHEIVACCCVLPKFRRPLRYRLI